MQQALEKFRSETRAWLEDNCPPLMRTMPVNPSDYYWGGRNGTFSSDDQRIWFERMLEKRWIAPHWPAEYGGGGLSPDQHRILQEEMRRLGCRMPHHNFGLSMLGPMLLKYGSEEQKREHLPKICRGEIRWCQGYSEPGAGSDLAGLRCRAELRGDHYLVNGQKIWTSYSDKADWIFALVRTDFAVQKQKGISFLLMDMTTPGISTRPILLISGHSPFCETFFDDVVVPKGNLVGKENEGWTYAKYLLSHEREMVSTIGDRGGTKTLGDTAAELIGKVDGKLADPVIRSEVAKVDLRAMAMALTVERANDEAKAGGGLGDLSSMLKYYGTEMNKDRHELIVSMAGMNGLAWEGEEFDHGLLARTWLRTKGNSIEGGTSEIQLNVIAKRVLGLPS